MIIKKLHRKKNNRELLFRNQVASLLLYERIETTKTKAKITKAIADKLITKAKTGNLNDIRFIFAYLPEKKAAKKLLKEILPRMADRNCGYFRNISSQNRLGDGAGMQILQFIDYKPIEKPKEMAEDLAQKPKADRATLKRDKKLDNLTKTENKSDITTIVRKKGERRISNEK